MTYQNKTKKQLIDELVSAKKEKHRILEQLETDNKNYRRFLDTLDTAVAIHTGGKLVYVNRAALMMSGLSDPAELIGKPPLSFVHPDYRQRVAERIRQNQEQGKPLEPLEETWVMPDGKEVVVEVSAVPITYNGKPATQVISRDISDERIRQESIRQNTADILLINAINTAIIEGSSFQDIMDLLRSHMKEVFSSIGLTFYLLSPDKSHLVMQNLSIPGKTRTVIEKMMGSRIRNFNIPLKEGSLYKEILEGKKTRSVTDRNTVYAMMNEFTDNPVLKKLIPKVQRAIQNNALLFIPLVIGNETIGLIDFSRNEPFTGKETARLENLSKQLTALIKQKIMTDQLEESEKRFRELITMLPEIVFEADARGFLTFVSQRTHELMEYLPEDFEKGIHFTELLVPEDRERAIRNFKAKLKDSHINYTEYKALTKSGKKIDIMVHTAPKTENGKIEGLRGIIIDISDRKKVETEQSILNEIIKDINTTISLDELLQRIHLNISRAINAENCYIALYDPDTQLLSFPLWRDQEDPQPTPRKKRKGLTEYVMNTKKPLLGDQKQIDRLTVKKKLDVFGTTPLSWLGVPLMIKNQCIGVLAVQNYDRKDRLYTETDRELLSTIGIQVALAIERKTAQEQIQKQNEFLHNILESLTHPFCVIDAKTYKIKIFNKATMSRRESDTTCHRLFHRRADPCGDEEVCPVREVIRTKKPVIAEHIHSGGKDDPRHWEIHAYPIFDSTGNVSEVIEYSLDITRRKTAMDKLQKSEIRHRLLVEHSLDGILVVSRKGIISVNNALCEMVQRSPEEMIGKQPLIFLHPDEHEKAKTRLKVLFSGESPGKEVEYRAVRSDGSILWIEVLSKPFFWEKEVQVQILVRDLTDRKKAQEELQRAQKLESLGILAGGIAHDFNNILTGILGNLSLAKTNIEPGEKNFKIISEAENASMKAKSLTKQLLTFAKGGTPLKKIFNVRDLLSDSVSFTLRGSNVTYEIETEGDLWAIEGDEGQIAQVINNLILNADQSMPDGGLIRIRCHNFKPENKSYTPVPFGKYIRITITDHGIGIPDIHINKIFDPYFSTKQKGSGLGLAVCYSIIKEHKGHITVTSELGKGTTFTLLLPAVDQKKPGGHPDNEQLTPVPIHVLLMDDEQMIRDVVTSMLTHIGCEVESVRDGKEALETYQKFMSRANPIDVVIMDLIIPGGMGGKETIENLLKIDPEARAIVSSGYSNDPIISNYSKYGFRDVITKPYKIDELNRVLKRVIGR